MIGYLHLMFLVFEDGDALVEGLQLAVDGIKSLLYIGPVCPNNLADRLHLHILILSCSGELEG